MPAHDLSVIPVSYKPIAGFPNYVVGSDGSVWSLRRPWEDEAKRLNPMRMMHGYQYVVLFNRPVQRNMTVHRLVLEAFVGPCPDGMQARHLDGNHRNNWIDNLAWGTAKENSQDRIRHGTQTRGETNGNSKLKEPQVQEIKALIAEGLNNCEIARRFGVTYTPIRDIRLGETWKHVKLPEP